MIQNFREKLSGVVAGTLIVLIAIPLAFFGIDSLFLTSNRLADVAEVNDQKISELELKRAIAARRNQIAQMSGENYSPDMVSDAELRETAMNDLITQKLFLAEAHSLDLGTSDRLLAKQLLDIPQFKLDDTFSDVLFRNYLGQMGYTSATFLESFSDELNVRQLTAALSESGFGTDLAVNELIGVAQETRSYQYVELPIDSALGDIDLGDEEILAYYNESGSEFEQPERLSVDYVSLTRDMFTADVEVSAEEVAERFELLQASQPDQREVAHILVEASEDESHVATLDAIQAGLEAGEAFGALAEEFSDDVGSSANGGHLGFSTGDAFPFEFEQALLDMDVGEVSAPVQTEAGFHLIKLLDIQSTSLDIEKEYAGLELSAKQEKAEELYAEALEEFKESALSTDNLDQLIEDMRAHAEIDAQATDLFERDRGVGIAANAQLRAVAFGSIVLEDNLNSEVVELSDTDAVVIHRKDYAEAGIAPFEQVSAEIADQLRIEKATELLAGRAAALADELGQGIEPEDIARRENLKWQVKLDQQRGTGSSIGDQIFDLALEDSFPQSGSLVQPAGGYIIYRLDAAEAGSVDALTPAEKRRLRSQLGQQISGAEFAAYTATLRESADIDVSIAVDIEI